MRTKKTKPAAGGHPFITWDHPEKMAGVSATYETVRFPLWGDKSELDFIDNAGDRREQPLLRMLAHAVDKDWNIVLDVPNGTVLTPDRMPGAITRFDNGCMVFRDGARFTINRLTSIPISEMEKLAREMNATRAKMNGSARPAAAVHSGPVAGENYIFRHDGDVWRIRYDGRDLNAVRDSDGMTYIRTLLSNKLPVHFANLYREAHPAPPEALANPHAAEAGAIAAAHGTGGKIQHVYDADYLKQMRDRVADIESRLTNPELSNKQQEHLEDELEKLTAILKQHSATRHAGGITAFKKVKGSCTRQAIAHAIKTAIERIVKVNPQDKELAKHLKHGFKYGTEPHYIGGLTWA